MAALIRELQVLVGFLFFTMICSFSSSLFRSLMRPSTGFRNKYHAYPFQPICIQKLGLCSTTSNDEPSPGEWVTLIDTDTRARVVSKSRGWWRLMEEGQGEIISVRTSAFRSSSGEEVKDRDSRTTILNRSFPEPYFLDERLYPLHSSTKEWVVFSDLHCSAQTLGTCRQVLARVHEEAQARNAGIIFLGDFWHIRGAIRVEVLNSIMLDLGKWTQPVVMIPGNHDQVTLDGRVHGLTPLAFAIGSSSTYSKGGSHRQQLVAEGGGFVSQAVVLTEPTIFMDALWLPYSRDASLTRALLAPYHHQEGGAAAADLVKAIFCHVDVRGAAMNDNTASKRGLKPSTFPPHLPVYSGHFHKPHTVPRSPVSYVGSPYQVSLSEAGQQKRLMLLRRPEGPTSSSWDFQGNIGLDIGRRYFRPASVVDARVLLEKGSLRQGDRVVLNLADGADDPEVEKLRGQLQETVKAELEVREVSEDADGVGSLDKLLLQEAQGGILDYESLGSAAVWQAYMQEGGKEKDGDVTEEGLKLIESWEAGGGNASVPLRGSGHQAVRLEFHSVKVEGYGPFRESIEYPLGDRGLVMLRGKNLDDPGAESNAAGKSKLAMAPLWALTGEGDERPVMDAKVTDIAFDVTGKGRSAFADVTLIGAVNGVDFEVTRKRGPRMNQLRFLLGGEDLSRQGVRDTQKVMEEALGLDLDFLSLAIFCGQHQMSGLLEATDVRLKERLAKIVRLGVWEDLKDVAKTNLKKYQELVIAAETQVRIQELDLERQKADEAELMEVLAVQEKFSPAPIRSLEHVEEELAQAGKKLEAAKNAWKAAIEEREKVARNLAEAAGESVGARRERLRALRTAFDEDVQAITMIEDRWDPELYWMELQRWRMVPKDSKADSERGLAFAAHVKKEEWDVKAQAVDVARARCLAEIGGVSAEVQKLEGALSSLSLGKGVPDEFCPTCGRPWDEGEGDIEKAKLHLNSELTKLQGRLKEAKEKRPKLEKQRNALARIAEAHTQYLRDVVDWEMLTKRLDTRGKELADLQKLIAAVEEETSDVTNEDANEALSREKEFRECQMLYDKLQDERPRLVQQQAELQARERAAAESRKRLEKKKQEVMKLQENLEKAREIRKEQERKVRLSRDLVERFGMRGVQAFVLRGAVAQLERLANRFLSLLSDSGLRLGLSLEGEKISKEVKVRGADGIFHDRTLSQLSGGQWRRASLATLMAFRELSRLRSRVDCNVIVLDEVLNHLDGPGRARVGRLLRAMCHTHGGEEEERDEDAAKVRGGGGVTTALVILQDLVALELEDMFDAIDEVVKQGDVSTVVLDGKSGEDLWDEEAAADDNMGSSEEMLLMQPSAAVSSVKFFMEDGDEDDQIELEVIEEEEEEKEEERRRSSSSDVVRGGWLDGLEEAQF